MTLNPAPAWPEVHVEFHEAPGWVDDCFRSTLWTKILSSVAESFINPNDISGDIATMAITEGAVPSGCGWEKDISSLALSTTTYKQLRTRLRGRGTTPQYQLVVEYTDGFNSSTGWMDASTDFIAATLQLSSGKTVKKVKLYAKCNTGSGSAQIDYDYATLQSQSPIIPYELTEAEVDLQHTIACGGFRLRAHHDVLQGVTALRYRFDENIGVVATDLSYYKLNGTLINSPTWQTGKYNQCLQFVGASSQRVNTGYLPTISANGAITISVWVKGSSGATGIIIGSGKVPGGSFNRCQLNFQSTNKIRIYVKDDAGNIRQYTSTAVVLDDTWHHVVAIVNPSADNVDLYVDGVYDGSGTGALGVITLDAFDMTIGCLHNESGYSSYATCYIDELAIFIKALCAKEIYELYKREPSSGISRVSVGTWTMIYMADPYESLVYKLMKGRVIDKTTGGDADQPWIEFTGEDQGEIIQDRAWSRDFTSGTQISSIVSSLIDDSVDELYKDIDTTNRTIVNKFMNENCWNVLQKLAESASFPTSEFGANIFVDPGGCFRFKKFGAFTSSDVVTDGSDGNTPNIIDIQVRESIKDIPKMTNDVKVIIFEEENKPVDCDGYTESTDGWSSPDTTDFDFPQSDPGDKVCGSASVKFQTTNPGSVYRMRLYLSDIDISGFDEVKFYLKYGVGLTIDSFRFQMLKGTFGATGDYYEKTGIIPPGAAAWNEITIAISSLSRVGYPGKVVNALEIRAEQATQLGLGGFLIDKVRFIRTEKSGSSSDAIAQAVYGKRSLTIVDKNISSTTWATNVAANIVTNRKFPISTVKATIKGRGQLGFRPSQKVTVSSLKDGLLSQEFQIVRARHQVSLRESYIVDLDMIAAKTSITPPCYRAFISLAQNNLENMLTEQKMRMTRESTNVLRSQYY